VRQFWSKPPSPVTHRGPHGRLRVIFIIRTEQFVEPAASSMAWPYRKFRHAGSGGEILTCQRPVSVDRYRALVSNPQVHVLRRCSPISPQRRRSGPRGESSAAILSRTEAAPVITSMQFGLYRPYPGRRGLTEVLRRAERACRGFTPTDMPVVFRPRHIRGRWPSQSRRQISERSSAPHFCLVTKARS